MGISKHPRPLPFTLPPLASRSLHASQKKRSKEGGTSNQPPPPKREVPKPLLPAPPRPIPVIVEQRLGESYLGLGLPAAAIPHLRRALAIIGTLGTGPPPPPLVPFPLPGLSSRLEQGLAGEGGCKGIYLRCFKFLRASEHLHLLIFGTLETPLTLSQPHPHHTQWLLVKIGGGRNTCKCIFPT